MNLDENLNWQKVVMCVHDKKIDKIVKKVTVNDKKAQKGDGE